MIFMVHLHMRTVLKIITLSLLLTNSAFPETKVKSEMKNQLNLIGNDFDNASVLLEKYAQTCKNLIENKKERISFWEKKSANKFK